MVDTTDKPVSQHVLQGIFVVAMLGERSQRSHVLGDSFSCRTNSAVKLETLHDAGRLGVVVFLQDGDQLSVSFCCQAIAVDQTPDEFVSGWTAHRKQDRALFCLVLHIVRDEVMVQPFSIRAEVFFARVKRSDSYVHSH